MSFQAEGKVAAEPSRPLLQGSEEPLYDIPFSERDVEPLVFDTCSASKGAMAHHPPDYHPLLSMPPGPS